MNHALRFQWINANDNTLQAKKRVEKVFSSILADGLIAQIPICFCTKQHGDKKRQFALLILTDYAL